MAWKFIHLAVGLAAWIIERFYTWTDNKGDLGNSFTSDELLTNIMIYWITQTINPSMRTYLENTKAAWGIMGIKKPQRVEIPTAVALFPKTFPFRRNGRTAWSTCSGSRKCPAVAILRH